MVCVALLNFPNLAKEPPHSKVVLKLSIGIQKRPTIGAHLGITEDLRPLSEVQIGCDHDRCAFVQLADQVKQALITPNN